MFVDQIRIQAKAGDGGNGCVSFRREKFVPRGGPDGGDGGEGADVILEADIHTDNLVSLYYAPILRGDHGGHGLGKKKHGKSAKDVVIKVPMGTLIYRLPDHLGPNVSPQEADLAEGEVLVKGRKIDPADLELLADLTEPGARYVLGKGGRGGKGNVHFKNSRNRTPREFTEGGKGEEGHFFLELRKIADVGLVGYPNAGKSTLISGISAAHPKVAPYPFTTLNPVVGVVQFSSYRRITVADIPGLVEGAHRNVGLGYDFLRHVVRCRLLLFVIDMAGSEGRDPCEDLARLRQELKMYDPMLAERPWMVVANKMDLPEAQEQLPIFQQRFPRTTVVPVSASDKTGLQELLRVVEEIVGPEPARREAGAAEGIAPESLPPSDGDLASEDPSVK